MVTVEELYKNFGVLADAKDKAGEHEAEFTSILTAVKGGPGEKRLASQFIARFFKYFPHLSFQAINALFDLCEDDDVNIRKQAIKDLPSLCKVNSDHVPKIAEALTQLLQCEDSGELSLVQSSLVNLFQLNAKGTLQGVFSQILGDDDTVRDKAIQFLAIKLRSLPEDTLDKDAEDFAVAECKKVLQDVTKDEFIAVMNVLKCLKTMGTVPGRQVLVDIVTEQAELDQAFEASDADCVDRLMSCIKQVTPLISRNVHSKQFVEYICDNVLPGLQDLAAPEEGVNVQLEILKVFADISEFSGEVERVTERVEKIFNRLLEYMPLPPSEENDELSATGSEEPKLQFSFVECLMFAFHQLGQKCPEFLTDEAHSDRLKDFRLRLQYFARGVQVYIKQLKQALQGKTGEALKTDENKIKVVALKITSNINALIKDLFHNPPSYKTMVSLSWKPMGAKSASRTESSNGTTPGQKRFTPITFESDGASDPKKGQRQQSGSRQHVQRAIYAPPGGKFSEKAGTFDTGSRGRGRGGGGGRRGGGFRRGRGGYRGGYY